MYVIMTENILYNGRRVCAGDTVSVPNDIAEKFIANAWAAPEPVIDAPAVEEVKKQEPASKKIATRKKAVTKRVKK